MPSRVEYETLSDEPSAEIPKRPTGLGLELGTLGRPTNANADLVGLQMLFGGRFFMRLPLARNFYLRPALGYFRKGEGNGGTGVVQHSIDAGGTVQWVPWPEWRLRPIFGICPRVEALFSQISAFDSSGTSTGAYRFRLGPSAGLAYSIDRTLNLIADLEVSFPFTQPVRPYAGMTVGFIYRID